MFRIVAIKDMSAGNETVGEMWMETKIFSPENTIKDVMDWAGSRGRNDNVTLTTAKEDNQEGE